MFKKVIAGFFLSFCLLGLPRQVLAITDPLAVPNNKFGIHIIDEYDLEDAAHLVNSSGGDWGYVTLVIREDERNRDKWQKVFDKMRRFHLVPIVRIATQMENGGWKKPAEGDIDSWVSFLNSLNWVVENRYIIISNEPNHAKEWGGELDPAGYATYLKSFSQRLKLKSGDFFIISAGLDASAPNSRETMDEAIYLERMLKAEPDVFELVDGLASHSYPNPHFSGSENGWGKGSVRTYLWELDYLKSLGVTKKLPVFITETGWLTSNPDISGKLKNAYQNAWNNDAVVAVTPFILNYQDPLFGEFSWKKFGEGYHDFYFEVQKLPKTSGKPVQKVSGKILSVFTPIFVKVDDPFYVTAIVENTGQAIWSKEDVVPVFSSLKLESFAMEPIEPKHKGKIVARTKAPTEPGALEETFSIYRGKTLIGEHYKFKFTAFEPPNLQLFFESVANKIRQLWPF